MNSNTEVPVHMVMPQMVQQPIRRDNIPQNSSSQASVMHTTMTMTQAPLQHQMQPMQQNLNATSNSSVHMVMPEMNTQVQMVQNVQNENITHSSSSQPTLMHNTMTMTQPSLQPLHVIPQQYFQQVIQPYSQQQILFPPNLTLQQPGTTPIIQGLSVSKPYTNQAVLSKTINTAQVQNTNHLKQIQTQSQITAHPQVSQASGQTFVPQMFGHFTQLPQNVSWTGNFQSPTFLPPNSIIIRNQQPDMFIQQPQQTTMIMPIGSGTTPATGTYIYATVSPKQPQPIQHKPLQHVAPAPQQKSAKLRQYSIAVGTQTNASEKMKLPIPRARLNQVKSGKGGKVIFTLQSPNVNVLPMPAPVAAETQTQSTFQLDPNAANQTLSCQTISTTTEIDSSVVQNNLSQNNIPQTVSQLSDKTVFTLTPSGNLIATNSVAQVHAACSVAATNSVAQVHAACSVATNSVAQVHAACSVADVQTANSVVPVHTANSTVHIPAVNSSDTQTVSSAQAQVLNSVTHAQAVNSVANAQTVNSVADVQATDSNVPVISIPDVQVTNSQVQNSGSSVSLQFPNSDVLTSNYAVQLPLPTSGVQASNSAVQLPLPTSGMQAGSSTVQLPLPTSGMQAGSSAVQLPLPTSGVQAASSAIQLPVRTASSATPLQNPVSAVGACTINSTADVHSNNYMTNFISQPVVTMAITSTINNIVSSNSAASTTSQTSALTSIISSVESLVSSFTARPTTTYPSFSSGRNSYSDHLNSILIPKMHASEDKQNCDPEVMNSDVLIKQEPSESSSNAAEKQLNDRRTDSATNVQKGHQSDIQNDYPTNTSVVVQADSKTDSSKAERILDHQTDTKTLIETESVKQQAHIASAIEDDSALHLPDASLTHQKELPQRQTDASPAVEDDSEHPMDCDELHESKFPEAEHDLSFGSESPRLQIDLEADSESATVMQPTDTKVSSANESNEELVSKSDTSEKCAEAEQLKEEFSDQEIDVVTPQIDVDTEAVPGVVENGVILECDTKCVSPPHATSELQKQRLKAIVRPHILTHIIDGFVIYESSEPFPVSRSALMSDSCGPLVPKMPDDLKRLSDPKHLDDLKNPDEPTKPDLKKPNEPTKTDSKSNLSEPKKRGRRKSRDPKKHDKNEPKSDHPKTDNEPKKSHSKKNDSSDKTKKPSESKLSIESEVSLDASNADKTKDSTDPKNSVNLLERRTSDRIPAIISEHVPKKRGRKRKELKSRRGRKKLNPGLDGSSVEVIELDVDSTPKLQEVKIESEPMPESKLSESNISEEALEQSLPTLETPAIEKTTPEQIIATSVDQEKLDFSQKLPTEWSVEDVCDFVRSIPNCQDYAEEFKSQEIDGKALLLLKVDHIVTFTSMKFGPALKLISLINDMKEKYSLEV